MAESKKKKTTKSASATSQAKPRKIKTVPKAYKSFKLSKRLKHPAALPSSWRLFKTSMKVLVQQKKAFFGVFVIFLILSVVLVRGFGAGAATEDLRLLVTDLFEGGLGRLIGSAAVLSILATDVTTAPTEVAGLYQTILFLLTSLAVIYVLRTTQSGNAVTIRESFYRSMYPLVPFLLVLFVIGLQLLPLAAGAWLFGTVTSAGLAVHGVEIFAWGVIFFLLGLLSLYMITSSIFAMYIVTLPDMYPMQALRSARQLVRHRRWTVMRKLLFLPLMVFLMGAVLLLPFVMVLPVLAEYAVLGYALAAVLLTHSYVYSMYRELL